MHHNYIYNILYWFAGYGFAIRLRLRYCRHGNTRNEPPYLALLAQYGLRLF